MFKFLLFLFFFLSVFFLLFCTFLFLFSFSFYFFLNFFFHNKLLIQCPLFFFSTLYLPLCLYLNTITIGSLPSLFNFSLQYHKLSLIYNTTFLIAYEHSNFHKFCQHFLIQNISESPNLRHTWFCQILRTS